MPGVGKYKGRLIWNDTGQRVRELGVNCPDLFFRWLSTSVYMTAANPIIYTPEETYRECMQDLYSRKIRFIRFPVAGFRTATYAAGYKNNPTTFFANLDALVLAAEQIGARLVPSLFFSIPLIPPYFSEPLSSYGNPQSQTYAEVTAFTNAVVNRYKNSPAIAYWEFCNEGDGRTSNPVTVPGYSTDVNMGQPAAWTVEDGWSVETGIVASQHFHDVCKAADPSRVTSSGYTGWAPGHLSYKQTFNIQTVMHTVINQDKTDTLDLHPYENFGCYSKNMHGLCAYLRQLIAMGIAINKPVIVGEFGCPLPTNTSWSGDNSLVGFTRILDNVTSSDVDIAMAWSYIANHDPNDPTWGYYNVSANLNMAYFNVLADRAQIYNLW